MQVRLTTTISTIIDIYPENKASFEEARQEIFGRLNEFDQDDIAEDIKSAHAEATVFDHVRAQSVTHSFEEVK